MAAGEGKLPSSLTEATIITLPKEGKNQLEVTSYRPFISLLCSDVKILAKVLAAQLKNNLKTTFGPIQIYTG